MLDAVGPSTLSQPFTQVNGGDRVARFLWKILLITSFNKKIGCVRSVSDGIAKAVGLKKTAMGEVVAFSTGGNWDYFIRGITCNMNKKDVDILILGNDRRVKAGHIVTGTLSGLRIPVSKKLLGRIVNPMGKIIDGGFPFMFHRYRANINVKAPGIIFRQKISEPLFTGIKLIDNLIPVGRGQRELIIGDKGTGKTSIAFDTILNQNSENKKTKSDKVYCIYVSIGQKKSSVKSIYKNLEKFGAAESTVIVLASASDSASLQYLAPYTGCAIGEFFMSFAHSLIIYDDLTQHAAAYRQISLLLRRPPGREAYPGDVFYLHSRLLERAAKLNKRYGGGSLTALPIIETLFGDVTAYIPTNVISITDGQIFLDRNLFTEGVLPAINIGLSVSRVGSAAQILAMKKVAGSLKLELAQYREVKDFIKFGSDLNDETLQLIKKGRLLTELLKQKRFSPVSPEKQTVILFAGLNGFFDSVSVGKEAGFINSLFSFIENSFFFRPNFGLLRFDSYFKEFGLSFLRTVVEYFTFYKLTI